MFASISRTVAPLVAIAALSVAAPTPVTAQEQVPVQPVENLDEAELETFAHAYIGIMQISQQAEASLAQVQDPERAQQVQAQAQQQMEAVLEEHGMEADRYRRIGMTINQDEALAQQFVAVIEEIQAGEGGGR